MMQDLEIEIDGHIQKMADHDILLSTVAKMRPGDVMAYITGARAVPSCGWSIRPSIHFKHEPTSRPNYSYSKASTCALQLHIPVTKDNLQLTKFLYTFAVSMVHGATFSDI